VADRFDDGLEYLDGVVAGLFIEPGEGREGVFVAGDDIVDDGQDLLVAVALSKKPQLR